MSKKKKALIVGLDADAGSVEPMISDSDFENVGQGEVVINVREEPKCEVDDLIDSLNARGSKIIDASESLFDIPEELGSIELGPEKKEIDIDVDVKRKPVDFEYGDGIDLGSLVGE